jgi:hypothetical protein
MRVRNALITAALGGPLILYAGDFWRDKEPSQWTSEEVNQMLTKSPWAKEVTPTFDRSRMGGGRGGGMGRRGGGMGGGGWGGMGGGGGWGGAGGGGGWGGMGGGGMGRRGGMGRPDGGQGGMAAQKATVLWESAAPIHEALVKSEAADASKFVDWSKDYYVVAVSGLPQMRMRNAGDEDSDRVQQMRERMEEQMKQNTSLKVQGRTIAPDRIETIESPGGRTVAFLFPRTANILAGDKEADFETSMGPRVIKAKFNLKDMLYKGKLEL